MRTKQSRICYSNFFLSIVKVLIAKKKPAFLGIFADFSTDLLANYRHL